MRQLTVELGTRTYPILIGGGLLARGELMQPYLGGGSAVVVTNTTIEPLYLPRLALALSAIGVRATTLALPDGETHKNWESLNAIHDAMLAARCEIGRAHV